jgi:hypothetical protein
VDDLTARPVSSPALLWAAHRCCEDGTLAVRAAEEVTPFSPHPLECRLTPGCRVELELAAKYGRDDTPDFGAESPFPVESWEMFVACSVYGPLDVEQCMNEWLLPACGAPICEAERRDDLVRWLEKVVSGLARPDLSEVFPVGAGVGDATLFTSRNATCCVAGTLTAGPYFVGGAVYPIACEYRAGCEASAGDLLYVGDATLMLAGAEGWNALPAVCSEEVAARETLITALEEALAAADMTRAALQTELVGCRTTVDSLRAVGGSGGPCVPGGSGGTSGPGGFPLLAHDRVVITEARTTLELLSAPQLVGGRVLSVSPSTTGIAVWEPDGLFTFFPHPSAVGTEVLSFQVETVTGTIVTATLEVVLP